jgi:hypothetical protein
MNRMNHVHHNEHPRSKNNSTASLLGITAVFVLLGCGGIYYAMSGSGTKATTPVVGVDTPIATARPDLASERSPAAHEPITPTPTPAPMAPKTPPSR